MHRGLRWGNLRERDHLEDLGVDGSIILEWIFKKWDGSMDWIDLIYDRSRWRAVLNAVMNLRFPHNPESFLSSRRNVSCSIRTLFH